MQVNLASTTIENSSLAVTQNQQQKQEQANALPAPSYADKVTLSAEAKALLANEGLAGIKGNGSGNEPPIKTIISNYYGNDTPFTSLGNGSGNEPPIRTISSLSENELSPAILGNGSGNEPPIRE